MAQLLKIQKMIWGLVAHKERSSWAGNDKLIRWDSLSAIHISVSSVQQMVSTVAHSVSCSADSFHYII